MLERDGLGECIGDAKVEIGVDIRVEIDFALFGELHNGRPGEGLGVGSNAKHGLFGIDRDAVFNVFVAVALGKEQFAILDDRDGCTGDVVFLHRRRKKIIKKGFQLGRIGRTLCGCWRDRHIAARHASVWLCHGWRDNRQQHR